jgi:hypothetical protein
VSRSPAQTLPKLFPMPHSSSDQQPVRYTTPQLAEKIASNFGEKPKTVTVKMVGKDDVADLLRKIRIVTRPAPASTYRIK